MTTDLTALWRERQAAIAAHEASDLEPDDDPAWGTYLAADDTIRRARPMTLTGIAVQARLLEDSIRNGQRDAELAARIAEQLEALAGEASS